MTMRTDCAQRTRDRATWLDVVNFEPESVAEAQPRHRTYSLIS